MKQNNFQWQKMVLGEMERVRERSSWRTPGSLSFLVIDSVGAPVLMQFGCQHHFLLHRPTELTQSQNYSSPFTRPDLTSQSESLIETKRTIPENN